MFARRLSALAASVALHLLAATIAISLATRFMRATSSQIGTSEPRVVVVHLAEAAPALSDDRASSKSTAADPEDLGIRLPDGESTLSLPGLTLDFAKVVKHAGSLFPFLTGRPSLERVITSPSRPDRGRLVNPFARGAGADGRKPPLSLRDADVQALLDKCWSRRDRWQAFQPIAQLARSHDPNVGALPVLLNRYGVQNGLQPYADARIRDPRLWTQLGLAADHADFIDFISGQVSEHTASKAATELLFLLDKLVQASFDALTVVLDTDPSEDLQWTRAVNRDAFAAFVAIRDYYGAYLERSGLTSRDSLRAYYGEARLAVLNTVLETTPNGYRANDARFASGVIHWKLGRRDEAVRVWREMSVVATDNEVADYSDILDELRHAIGSSPDARAINRILDRQQGRWITLSYDRLRQFGYHFDTF